MLVEIQQIAMRFNVDLATAALIFAQVLAGGPMPEAAMAGGGHARAGEPVLVGERGPEVFVPSVPGTVIPDWVKQKQWEYAARQAQPTGELNGLVPTDAQLARSLALRDQPGAYYEPWQPWQRDVVSKDWPTDFINAQLGDAHKGGVHALSPFVQPEGWDRWLASAPESQNIEDRRDLDAIDMDNIRWQRAHAPKKPLKQFPPAAEASSHLPDWLKDQESQWIKARK
jgi:hypothetical protein